MSHPEHLGHHRELTDAELEDLHFGTVLDAFAQYRQYSLSANSRRLKDFYSLPISHQNLLNELGFRKKIDMVDQRIEANAKFLHAVVDHPDIFTEDHPSGEDLVRDPHSPGGGGTSYSLLDHGTPSQSTIYGPNADAGAGIRLGV